MILSSKANLAILFSTLLVGASLAAPEQTKVEAILESIYKEKFSKLWTTYTATLHAVKDSSELTNRVLMLQLPKDIVFAQLPENIINRYKKQHLARNNALENFNQTLSALEIKNEDVQRIHQSLNYYAQLLHTAEHLIIGINMLNDRKISLRELDEVLEITKEENKKAHQIAINTCSIVAKNLVDEIKKFPIKIMTNEQVHKNPFTSTPFPQLRKKIAQNFREITYNPAQTQSCTAEQQENTCTQTASLQNLLEDLRSTHERPAAFSNENDTTMTNSEKAA